MSVKAAAMAAAGAGMRIMDEVRGQDGEIEGETLHDHEQIHARCRKFTAANVALVEWHMQD